MPQFNTGTLTSLLSTYGYLAVLFFVAMESTGIPFPGETMLISAAVFAGTTNGLNIGLVIASAAAGAIIGDNLGFWAGREGGYRLTRRYGKYIRLDERRLKLGQYLFDRHGGKVVFFGRFVAVLRTWAAFLAGTNRMSWDRFLFFNAAGGILWAAAFGLLGYILGNHVSRVQGPVRVVSIVLALAFAAAFVVFLRRNESRLQAEAERAMPGPLSEYERQAAHADTGE